MWDEVGLRSVASNVLAWLVPFKFRVRIFAIKRSAFHSRVQDNRQPVQKNQGIDVALLDLRGS
jgi:hypothetical protein